MSEAAIAVNETYIKWDEERAESKPDLVATNVNRFPKRPDTRDFVHLSEVFSTWAKLSSTRSEFRPTNIHDLALREPSTVAARLLAGDLTEEGIMIAVRTLTDVVAGRPSGGLAFILARLRRQAPSATLLLAIATAEDRHRVPPAAQLLERFLSRPQAPASDPLAPLRALERKVEAAYDALDAVNTSNPPAPEEALSRGLATLSDALAEEAAAAREILESRMSSLDRTAETARRADALIASYEPDPP